MEEKKILFIDDDESQREIVNDMIESFGYIVETADSPEKAIQMLEKDEYPLIITDLKMPGINGMELCKHIRTVNSESIIYALSGHVAEFEPELFEEIGFDGHLCKPVNIQVLRLAIDGAFERLDENRNESE
ncbi:MAG: response regulator [Deltaproteobacteria bacterium]|nr:response regulator [Deltaproteobacteria bacterium]